MANKPRKPRKSKISTVNTTGGAVRMTGAASDRSKTTTRQKAAVVVETVTPRSIDNFIDFLRERAVVGLAIGVVIGTQLKVITDALNNGFINPLFALIFDAGELNTQVLTVHWHGRSADLAWGAVVYQCISFIFILATFYAIIKFFRLDKLDKPKDKK